MQDHSSRSTSGSLEKGSLQEIVREVYLEERSGVLEVRVASEVRRFYFKEGELHLLDGHPLAKKLAALLAAEMPEEGEPPPGDGTGETPRFETTFAAQAQEEVKGLIARIARFLIQLEDGEFRFVASEEILPADLVGPLATGFLVMEMAVLEKDDLELADQVNGMKARLVAV